MKTLQRTTDPKVELDYVVEELWTAVQLVYDADDPRHALIFDAVALALEVSLDEPFHLSRIERLWAAAQKADAARPCKPASAAPIIATDRRTP